MQTGVYVDPNRGKITIGDWSARWLDGQAHLSRPRTSAMPASCASTFSRSGPLCNSSTSRTPTCRRGSRGWRRGARRRRCARFIASFHSSSRRPSGTVDWRGIRQRRSTCRGSSPPSADISRTSRCMHWPRRWRNPAEVSKHRRLDEREKSGRPIDRPVPCLYRCSLWRAGRAAGGRLDLLRRRAIIAESVTVVQAGDRSGGHPRATSSARCRSRVS